MAHKEVSKPTKRQRLTCEGEIVGCTCVSKVIHWIKIRRMSSSYNIIEYIPIGLRPFRLKYVSICYINYLRKLPKVFISPTIRCVEYHDQCEMEHAKQMSTTLDNGYLRWIIIGKLLL